MSIEKRRVGDPSDAAKLDLHREVEERVLKDVSPAVQDRPGKSIVQLAIAARDTHLLRSIAAERKGLTDQQRRALLFLADLLDHAAPRRSDQS